MNGRLHKVLLDTTSGVNQFASAKNASGEALSDPTVAARSVQPKWPAYASVCVDIHTLNANEVYGGGTHTDWVLRAEMRCCCAHDCPQPQDHNVSYRSVPKAEDDIAKPRQTAHGPAQGYVQATLHSAALATLATIAKQCASDATVRTREAALLSTDATTFNLSATDIEQFLGLEANGGVLTAAGRVAGVLAGTLAPATAADNNSVANDYYVVAAYLTLHQRLIEATHRHLTKAWPSRPVNKEIRHTSFANQGAA